MKKHNHLVNPLSQVLAILFLATLDADARTWTSANGKSTLAWKR